METTIAAISTAMSASGIGIVRISGEDAMEIISRIYRSKGGKKRIKEVPSHTIHYGYNGWCTPRCRLFAAANDCFADWCLRTADCVDFYCISGSQKSLDAVYFLSNYLDYYRWCPYFLLYSCQKKAITDDKESIKISK